MNSVFLDKEEQFKSDYHQLMSNKKRKLGEILREIRKEHKLLQREVAAAVGITRRNLTDIENGKEASLRHILRVFLYYQAQGMARRNERSFWGELRVENYEL